MASRRASFTGAPRQYHRAARRMGAGWSIPQVARMLGCDAMDLHLLLREAPFAELFRAHDDLRSLAPEARIARLREVALLVLEEALAERDPRVAWFVLRACELGQDPAPTLARGIAAAAARDRKAAGPCEAAPPSRRETIGQLPTDLAREAPDRHGSSPAMTGGGGIARDPLPAARVPGCGERSAGGARGRWFPLEAASRPLPCPRP
jgi:hypothetical protein